MKINVNIDDARLLLRLKNGQKRLAYAVVNAINATAKDVQQAERDRVRQIFHLRKTDFILRQAAVIKPFASVSQGRAYAEISVGQKPRLLLGRFEAGGDRPPIRGKSVAVPIVGGARPSKEAAIPPELFIQKLAFRKTRRAKRGGGAVQIWKGLLGTYEIPGVGIFQRIRGQARGKPLYIFSKVELPADLEFIATAQKTIAAKFSDRLTREVDLTLAYQSGFRGTVKIEP